MIRGIVLLLSVSGSGAFAPHQMLHRSSPKYSSRHQEQVLDDVDAMCIVNAANLCSQDDSFCDVDEEEALFNRLESHAHLLEIRLEEMRSLAFALSDRPRLATLDNHQFAGPVLDEIDTMCLMNAAAFCIDEGCDIEDKEALINRLHEQYIGWNLRLLGTVSAMRRLELHELNAYMYRPEVSSLMQSIGSALTMEYDMTDNKVPIGSYE